MKARGYKRPTKGFNDILMPKNTGTGVILAGLSVGFAFGMIWYIWWLAGLSLVAIFTVAIAHTFNYKRDFHISAEEIARTEDKRTKQLASQS
jgi:cytochrome o ubiquinol oxidase subunit 1